MHSGSNPYGIPTGYQSDTKDLGYQKLYGKRFWYTIKITMGYFLVSGWYPLVSGWYPLVSHTVWYRIKDPKWLLGILGIP